MTRLRDVAIPTRPRTAHEWFIARLQKDVLLIILGVLAGFCLTAYFVGLAS